MRTRADCAAAEATRARSCGPLGLTRPHGPAGSNAARKASANTSRRWSDPGGNSSRRRAARPRHRHWRRFRPFTKMTLGVGSGYASAATSCARLVTTTRRSCAAFEPPVVPLGRAAVDTDAQPSWTPSGYQPAPSWRSSASVKSGKVAGESSAHETTGKAEENRGKRAARIYVKHVFPPIDEPKPQASARSSTRMTPVDIVRQFRPLNQGLLARSGHTRTRPTFVSANVHNRAHGN